MSKLFGNGLRMTLFAGAFGRNSISSSESISSNLRFVGAVGFFELLSLSPKLN